jgi:hypothetical protein
VGKCDVLSAERNIYALTLSAMELSGKMCARNRMQSLTVHEPKIANLFQSSNFMQTALNSDRYMLSASTP